MGKIHTQPDSTLIITQSPITQNFNYFTNQANSKSSLTVRNGDYSRVGEERTKSHSKNYSHADTIQSRENRQYFPNKRNYNIVTQPPQPHQDTSYPINNERISISNVGQQTFHNPYMVNFISNSNKSAEKRLGLNEIS